MKRLEVTVDPRGRVTIPKHLRDAIGIEPGTRLVMRQLEGSLVLAKPLRLNLEKWIGIAEDDGLTPSEALRALRGRCQVPQR